MFKYFARGKRSFVYKGKIKGKDVILKIESKNLNRINNEIYWLIKLNKHKIGPEIYFCGKDWFICRFIKGEPLNKWVINKSRKRTCKVFRQILGQCRILDKLKVNKYEMHRPFKNVLVHKDKAYLIDFERCKYSLKPKNVSQFFQFVIYTLKLDRNEILIALKEYCKDYSDESFEKLVKKI